MSKEALVDCVNKHLKDDVSFTSIATAVIDKKHEEFKERNIWADSKFENIGCLEKDDVGNVGEKIIKAFCKKAKIPSDIDGTKTKKKGGGKGDGTIKGFTVEIKTAKLGSKNNSFQHELGHSPWKADYMLFLDISPKKMYITLFKNWSEEFYKKSGKDNKCKCYPCFPTRSICWRAGKGDFKLDSTVPINENSEYSFIIDNNGVTLYSDFKKYVDGIIN